MEVLALGGRTREDNAAESGYYLVRALMAREVSEAIRYVAERGIAEQGAPAIVRFLTSVGARFGVVITEKAAATIDRSPGAPARRAARPGATCRCSRWRSPPS